MKRPTPAKPIFGSPEMRREWAKSDARIRECLAISSAHDANAVGGHNVER